LPLPPSRLTSAEPAHSTTAARDPVSHARATFLPRPTACRSTPQRFMCSLGVRQCLAILPSAAVQRPNMSLQQRPKWARGSLTTGDRSVTVETRRTYLRTLRTFSHWLPKSPHANRPEPRLRHLMLSRASVTFKLPLADGELARLLDAKVDSVFGAS